MTLRDMVRIAHFVGVSKINREMRTLTVHVIPLKLVLLTFSTKIDNTNWKVTLNRFEQMMIEFIRSVLFVDWVSVISN